MFVKPFLKNAQIYEFIGYPQLRIPLPAEYEIS